MPSLVAKSGRYYGRIRESIHFGCPYCLGPIFFSYSDAYKHMTTEHPNWVEPPEKDEEPASYDYYNEE